MGFERTQMNGSDVERGLCDLTMFVCKLCLSREPGPKFVFERENRKSNVVFVGVRCAECGLFQCLYDWQAANTAQREFMADLQSRPQSPWGSEPELAAARNKAREFARDLDRRVPLEGKRVLDIGCSRGFFLRACLDLGAASATGQEFFDEGRIAYAGRELGVSDVRSLPFERHDIWPDDEFDVVTSFDVLEHIHDLHGFFREAIRITRPEGFHYHATPGSESISNRIGRGLVDHLGVSRWLREAGTTLCNLAPVDNFGGGAHVALLGVDQVRLLAAQYGMSLLDARYVNSYTHTNAHYAALVPGLKSLPRPAGSFLFGGLRSVIRNKLVFLARLDERRHG
jgi:2-polyprenyl-3-methyl-5-hydroxy-6-metoxy-1,4-benzoquinol methylase